MNAAVARNAKLVRRQASSSPAVLQSGGIRPAALSLWARWKGSAAAVAGNNAKKDDTPTPKAAAPTAPAPAVPLVTNPTTFEVCCYAGK